MGFRAELVTSDAFDFTMDSIICQDVSLLLCIQYVRNGDKRTGNSSLDSVRRKWSRAVGCLREREKGGEVRERGKGTRCCRSYRVGLYQRGKSGSNLGHEWVS